MPKKPVAKKKPIKKAPKKAPKGTNPVGRPKKFNSVEELQKKIDAYFAECDPHWVDVMEWVQQRDEQRKLVYDEDGQPHMVLREVKVKTKQIPYTITGLALALETTRETLLDYEDTDEYSDTVKAAKLKCQNYTELSLYGSNATGPIFSLKNNYAWKDRTEVEGSGEQKIIIETRKHNAD